MVLDNLGLQKSHRHVRLGSMAKTRLIERTRTEAEWVITARWYVDEDGPTSQGPAEVLLRLAEDASPKARVRGMTSGIMRRIEERLTELREDVTGRLPEARLSGVEARALSELLASMPASPREDPDTYYRALLSAFDLLTKSGASEPLNVLADRLSVPKNTVKTQLQTARRRYRQAD